MEVSQSLKRRLDSLNKRLSEIGRQARIASSHVSHNVVPGEFRSPYRYPIGFERDVPRVFTIDDDPSGIDTRHVPPSLVCRSLSEAILREDMRLIQSVHHGESRFALIVDLSRSMLSGCLMGGDMIELHSPARAKLQCLFLAVSVYLRIAEASGFVLRAIFLHGHAPCQEPPSAPRNFMQQVLYSMHQRLLESYRVADTQPDDREPFLLRSGCRMALTHRNRGVVVIVSDFLDPLEDYESEVVQVIGRHRVILVDVAAERDRNFPLPGWRDVEARRVPCREGARHLEEGTEPITLDAHKIRAWNVQRQAERARLESVVRRLNGQFVTCKGETYQQCYAKAIQLFDRTM